MIAGFIFLRLRGILGKRTGYEGKPPTPFEKILEKLSFEANLSEKRTEIVSKQWVSDAIQSEIKPTDEKKFIL